MKRIKLRDRVLPKYTKGEEIFNMVSHIVGGAFGIAALVLCVVTAAIHGSTAGVLTSVAYGVSLIVLYTMSSIYHGLRPPMPKKVFQVLDHCAIYFLIAGTYSPIAVCGLRRADPVAGWVVFGVVWFFTVMATVFTSIDLKKYNIFSMICYIGMGWSIIFAVKPTYTALTFGGFTLLVAGGIMYTAGAVLYNIGKRKKYRHAVFHVCVLLGSILHFLCILLYVL